MMSMEAVAPNVVLLPACLYHISCIRCCCVVDGVSVVIVAGASADGEIADRWACFRTC